MLNSVQRKKGGGGFIASTAIALLCAALIAIPICIAASKAQLAHADDPSSYRLYWDDFNHEGGGVSVSDEGGNPIPPQGTYVEEGTVVKVTFSPDEGKVLRLAFAYSGDLFSEDSRIESTLDGNTLTFTMPSKDVSIYCSFASEINSIGYNLASHGSTRIADQSGNKVDEARCGDTLTATYTPASGYYIKSAWLVYHHPLYGGEVKDELSIVDGKSVFEMPADEARVEARFARLDGKYEVTTYAYALGGSVIPQDNAGRSTYFFAPGETVYLKCSPSDGYTLDQVYLYFEYIGEAEAQVQRDGRYAFEMPETDVAANASFEPVSNGIKAWLNEYVVGSQGLDGPVAQGASLGDVWIADAQGKAVSGVRTGELAEVCVTPDDEHSVYAVKCWYSPLDSDEPGNEEITITPDSRGRYTFVMPNCDDISIDVYYQRVGDGKFDVACWSMEVKPEDMSVRFTDEQGRDITSAAPGDKVIFEYLPGTDFVLNYILNYMYDEEGSWEKLSATRYSFVMPDAPLTVEVGLSRVDVEVQTDGTAYVPESGQETARNVAMEVFWELVSGKTPKGMTDEEAQSLRNMLADPNSSGAYLDIVLRANETSITDSQEELILDVIEDDEFIAFSFDLSVIFSLSTDEGWGTEVSLTELSDGVHFQLMPDGAEGKFIRIVRIHEGVAEEVALAGVDGDGVIVEADRFSVYSAIASDTTTVVFESNGGSAVASQEIDYGQKLAEPADPTRAGYVFEGWYADEDLMVAYDFDDPVTQHLGTLYAKWSLDTSDAAPGTADGDAGSSQSSGSAVAKTGDNANLRAVLLGLGALVAAGAATVAHRLMRRMG